MVDREPFVYRRGNRGPVSFFSRRVLKTREFLVKVSLSSLPPPTHLRAVLARCPAITRATISDQTPPFHNILEWTRDKLNETMTMGKDSHQTDIALYHHSWLSKNFIKWNVLDV